MSTSATGTFLPICNVCLTEIEGGTQGFLLSCGHFVCHGCCQGAEPSVCPNCGSRGRAAVLTHPPVEVRDYLQNPLAQFRAANDVVMFQLDHFRSVAKQACKGLHELRLLYSQETKRREAAENEAQTLRYRVEEAESSLRGERGGASGKGGALGAAFGGKMSSLTDGRNTGGNDGTSPIGKLRPRFLGAEIEQARPPAATGAAMMSMLPRPERFGAASGENIPPRERRVSGGAAPLIRPPQQASSSTTSVDSWSNRNQLRSQSAGVERGQRSPQKAAPGEPGRAAAMAVVVASEPSGGAARPVTSFLGPPLARTLGRGEARKPDTPRAAVGQHPSSVSAARPRVDSGAERPRQGVPVVPQPPGTPDRPPRPAWQNGGGAQVGTGGLQRTARPPTPRNGQMPSPLARRQQQQPQQQQQEQQHQQQQQPKRPQRAVIDGIRRPAPAQGHTGGGGRDTGAFVTTPPRDARGIASGSSPLVPAGLRRPAGSPASPLLASPGGGLKRPSSGALPSPKRPGSASSTDRARVGNQQGRVGTPLTTTPLPASSASPRLRSPQLPFTSRPTPRPGSGQPRPGYNRNADAGRVVDGARRAPSTPTNGRQAARVPASLEAAGLFARPQYLNGGAR